MRKIRAGGGGTSSGGGGGTVNSLTQQEVVALATTSDFDPASATALAATPKGNVLVSVQGVEIRIGNGIKTKDAYFSGDGGTTARTWAATVSGDLLYWVGSVAGYQLAALDQLLFDYAIA